MSAEASTVDIAFEEVKQPSLVVTSQHQEKAPDHVTMTFVSIKDLVKHHGDSIDDGMVAGVFDGQTLHKIYAETADCGGGGSDDDGMMPWCSSYLLLRVFGLGVLVASLLLVILVATPGPQPEPLLATTTTTTSSSVEAFQMVSTSTVTTPKDTPERPILNGTETSTASTTSTTTTENTTTTATITTTTLKPVETSQQPSSSLKPASFFQ